MSKSAMSYWRSFRDFTLPIGSTKGFFRSITSLSSFLVIRELKILGKSEALLRRYSESSLEPGD